MDIPNKSAIVQKIKEKFTKIPNYILSKKELSDGAFKTYALLKSYKYGDNRVFPSISTLATARGKSRRTISSHIKELKIKEIIDFKRRGLSRSNSYTFIDEENCMSLEKNISLQTSREFPPNNTKNNKTEINKGDEKTGDGIDQLRKTVYALGIKK